MNKDKICGKKVDHMFSMRLFAKNIHQRIWNSGYATLRLDRNTDKHKKIKIIKGDCTNRISSKYGGATALFKENIFAKDFIFFSAHFI